MIPREIIAWLGRGAAASEGWPFATQAQQPTDRIRRFGVLFARISARSLSGSDSFPCKARRVTEVCDAPSDTSVHCKH
jgi:hypothetical protein